MKKEKETIIVYFITIIMFSILVLSGIIGIGITNPFLWIIMLIIPLMIYHLCNLAKKEISIEKSYDHNIKFKNNIRALRLVFISTAFVIGYKMNLVDQESPMRFWFLPLTIIIGYGVVYNTIRIVFDRHKLISDITLITTIICILFSFPLQTFLGNIGYVSIFASFLFGGLIDILVLSFIR